MVRLDCGISEVLASVSLKDAVFRNVAMWWLFNDVSEESAFSDLGVEGHWRAEIAGQFVPDYKASYHNFGRKVTNQKFSFPLIIPLQNRRWEWLRVPRV